jgi:hypothetical protein
VKKGLHRQSAGKTEIVEMVPLGASAILLTTVRNLLSGLRLEKGPVSHPRRP